MKSFSFFYLVALLLIPHQSFSQKQKEAKKNSRVSKTARAFLTLGPWAISIFALWQLRALQKDIDKKEQDLSHSLATAIALHNGHAPTLSAPLPKQSSTDSFGTRVETPGDRSPSSSPSDSSDDLKNMDTVDQLATLEADSANIIE